MNFFPKIGVCLKAIYNEDMRFKIMNHFGMCDNMPDEEYLKKLYKLTMGVPLNLDNPQTFNEKLQWLKLHDRKDIYTVMVDKYLVKKYVADIIGEEYIIPTIGVWDDPDEIDFDKLPEQFVLKCNHDSGGLIICKDKCKLNIGEAKVKLRNSLKKDFYLSGREWPYKNVPRKIIAEQYIDLDNCISAEYKLFCNYGEVKWVMVCTGKAGVHGSNGRTNDGYDKEFNHLPVTFTYPNSEVKQPKPIEWEVLKELAQKVTHDLPIARFDTYVINGKIFFGEITFYHDGGCCNFKPEKWDYKFGNMFDISNVLECN